MATEPRGEKRIRVELTVLESQRDELELAWQGIICGRRPRMDALNHEIAVITERAMSALRERNPPKPHDRPGPSARLIPRRPIQRI